MRNIARFLFRILFFGTSYEKKRRLPEAALQWTLYQTYSESSPSLKFEMGMTQSKSRVSYPFYLVIQHLFFYELKRNLFDDSIAAFHILLYVFYHPIVTDDLSNHIRIRF